MRILSASRKTENFQALKIFWEASNDVKAVHAYSSFRVISTLGETTGQIRFQLIICVVFNAAK